MLEQAGPVMVISGVKEVVNRWCNRKQNNLKDKNLSCNDQFRRFYMLEKEEVMWRGHVTESDWVERKWGVVSNGFMLGCHAHLAMVPTVDVFPTLAQQVICPFVLLWKGALAGLEIQLDHPRVHRGIDLRCTLSWL